MPTNKDSSSSKRSTDKDAQTVKRHGSITPEARASHINLDMRANWEGLPVFLPRCSEAAADVVAGLRSRSLHVGRVRAPGHAGIRARGEEYLPIADHCPCQVSCDKTRVAAKKANTLAGTVATEGLCERGVSVAGCFPSSSSPSPCRQVAGLR